MSNLKESMVGGKPFPKVHTKAAETKALIEPIIAVVTHLKNRDPSKKELMESMLRVLQCSHQIDALVDGMEGFRVLYSEGEQLEALVQEMNAGTVRLCKIFLDRGMPLFNFVPKHHYLYHLSQLGRHMSPKLAWCYQGEDLMQKIKVLAQGSFRGTQPRKLGNKICGKYLLGLSGALSSC